MYWLGIYASIAVAIFAMAGLFILTGFAWSELKGWLRPDAPSFSNSRGNIQHQQIGISVAIPKALANGGSDKMNESLYTTASLVQSSICSDVHEMTAAFVAHISVSAPVIRPYGLAGALVFRPTDDAESMNTGIDTQAKAAFVYGGGANFDVTRYFGIRAEYCGLVYKAPSFKLDRLPPTKWLTLHNLPSECISDFDTHLNARFCANDAERWAAKEHKHDSH